MKFDTVAQVSDVARLDVEFRYAKRWRDTASSELSEVKVNTLCIN